MKYNIKNDYIKSNNIAIKDINGNCSSYLELYLESEELVNKIGKRNLVFILCDYNMDTVKFIYKTLISSNVCLLLPWNIDMEFLLDLIKLYKPNFLWCKKNNFSDVEYSVMENLSQHYLLRINKERIKLHPELALLLSTSGSTGSHKMVKISYENLNSNAYDVIKRCEVKSEQKGITTLPLNYTYGLSFALWHWLSGATLLVTEEPVISKQFINFFDMEEVNNFAAIPYTYEMMDRIKFWDIFKVDMLNFAMCGGARITETLQEQMVLLMDKKFWIVYGQTECTCVISTSNFEKNDIRYGTVGKPLNSIEITVDDNGQLVVNSKSVSMGYASSYEQLEKGNLNKQELETGDIAKVDEDGFIYLEGRLNRYIKILGKRISLDEVEAYLSKEFQGSFFACVGNDEDLKIYYECTEQRMMYGLENEVKRKLDVVIGIPYNFVQCYRISHIPRNESGKILYSVLKEGKYGRKDK